MKKICIIGAGITGLSIGCYAQMNGYDSEIYEMHNTPGGGVPMCMAQARRLVKYLCKKEKSEFVSII